MTEIPQEILESGDVERVHVKGWNPACQFFYVRTDCFGRHILTTKKRKRYLTKNKLLFLRWQEIQYLKELEESQPKNKPTTNN